MPATADAASLHVVFPQTAEVTVVQGQSADFTLQVQAYGAISCEATSTSQVRIDSLYSIDSLGDIAPGDAIDMPLHTAQNRGSSDNCYIQNPVLIPLTATAAADTPVGDYTSVIKWGKGGDGDTSLDGPSLTIHVVAPDQTLPQPDLAPPAIIVLGEREAPHPTLGKTVMLSLVKGTVRYRPPGNGISQLSGTVIVPNGTLVDATNGVVKVTVVHDHTGSLDSADAWGGGFIANQTSNPNRPLTSFQLSAGLGASSSRTVATAAAARHGNSRLLWVNGKGNFKTRGKRASAIVRGTFWLTQETTAGTKVSVKRGLVAVRDFVHKRTVLVGAGHSYTAKPRTARVQRVPAFTGSV